MLQGDRNRGQATRNCQKKGHATKVDQKLRAFYRRWSETKGMQQRMYRNRGHATEDDQNPRAPVEAQRLQT